MESRLKGIEELNKILQEVQDMSVEEYMELYNEASKKETIKILVDLTEEIENISQEEFATLLKQSKARLERTPPDIKPNVYYLIAKERK